MFEGASCIVYFQVCGLKSERTVCCEDGSPSGAFLNSPSVIDPNKLLFPLNFIQFFKSKTRVMCNIASWIESKISWQWNLFFREEYIVFCNHRCKCKFSFSNKFPLEICDNILITSHLIHLTSEHLRFCSYVISCSVNQCWDYRWRWNVKVRFNIVETC